MPRSSDGSVSAIRSALKKRLLEPQQPLGFDTERKQVFDLIEATARFGESNSALLIGPASVGKTTVSCLLSKSRGRQVGSASVGELGPR